MGANALSLEDNAWALSRVMRLDQDIREDSKNSLLNKKRRAALLIETSKNIGNLMNTWNLVPTTDKTLEYTLTLQKYKLSCEIAAMKTVF